jgi:TPR repeat protein
MKAFLATCAILLFLGVFALVYTLVQYILPEEETKNMVPVQLAVGGETNETTPATSLPEDLEKERTSGVLTEAEDAVEPKSHAHPLKTPIDLLKGRKWKYEDSGRDLGVEWREADFDDAAWDSGPAPLGYGDDDIATVIEFGPNEKRKYLTSYFRTDFEVAKDLGKMETLTSLRCDDGAIIYLNGKEVIRYNMPAGDIGYRELSLKMISDQEESKFTDYNIDSKGIKKGRNVLAAEVHQRAGVSSDLIFDLRFILTGKTSRKHKSKTDQELASPDLLPTTGILSAKQSQQGVFDELKNDVAAPVTKPKLVKPEPAWPAPLPNFSRKGLVAYYPFNGNARNEAGDDHHGTVVGAKLTVDRLGKANGAYQFKLGDYIKIDGLMGEPKSLTLAAWAKLEGRQGSMGAEIISIGGYVTLRMDNRQTDHNSGTGGLFFIGRKGSSYWVHSMGKTNYTGTGWHQVVFTVDANANKQITYVDGQQAVAKQNPNSIVYKGLGRNTYFGIHGSGDPEFKTSGVIDDIRVYDRALSFEEVKELFLKEKPPHPLQAGKEIEVITLDEWRERAQAGDHRAQFQMGLKAINGVAGLKRNPVMAAEWWLRAAKQGHGFAQMNLGLLHSRGALGEKDPKKAYQWAKLSLLRGNQRAGQLVEKLERELSPDSIAEAEAFVKAYKPVRENSGLEGNALASTALAAIGSALPKPMKNRSSRKARVGSIASGGGKQQIYDAISRGLEWLEANQDDDGSWGANDKRSGLPFSTDKNAMTGMALLCFLGHGQLQDSPEYGTTVRRAIESLISTPPEDSGITQGNRGSYSHPIRTYALCEAYAMTKQRKLKPFAEKATEAIIKGQHESGGWAYGYRKGPTAHVDLSVTGWNVQALKAATLTGLRLDGLELAMDKAMAYVKRCQDEDGKFAYKEGTSGKASLTGAGVLCLQLWKNAKSHEVQKGLEWIVNNQAREWSKVDVYAWYYHAQACFQATGVNGGAKYWKAWNEDFQQIVCSAQESDGHWPHGAHFHGDTDVFRTTLTILMLQVYYRFTPSW